MSGAWRRNAVAAVCFGASIVALSACTSNSSFPSGSLSAALTPQDADIAAVAESSKETEEAEDLQQQAPAREKAGGAEQRPEEVKETAETEDTQLALAPTAGEVPSVEATNSVVQQTTTPKQKPVNQSAAPKEPTSAEVAVESQETNPEKTEPEQSGSFFSRLFKSAPSNPKAEVGETRSHSPKTPAPSVRVVSRKRGSTRKGSRGGGSIFGLPGVKRKNIFAIEDEIEREEFDEPIRTASIANLATRGRHGLLLQRPDVKVGCFPRSLLTILRQVERRYKRTPIVTSGYRSPRHNRLVRGARKSTHIRCMAADIQVKGVSKWQLAKFLRTLPGRGGVGTYCHTKSVHIDIGSKRAWHYCRRSRKSRRRKT